eukprot:766976-Hanusia_phi.AAC.4
MSEEARVRKRRRRGGEEGGVSAHLQGEERCFRDDALHVGDGVWGHARAAEEVCSSSDEEGVTDVVLETSGGEEEILDGQKSSPAAVLRADACQGSHESQQRGVAEVAISSSLFLLPPFCSRNPRALLARHAQQLHDDVERSKLLLLPCLASFPS